MGFDVGNRLAKIRKLYGFSQRELAKRAGVTNGIISMIEKNRNSPSIATLKKILDGIPISMADFFTHDLPTGDQVFFSADELTEISSSELISYRQIGGNINDKAMQVMHETLLPGADTGNEMYRHESEESGVVIKGQLELTVGNTTRILGEGDAYYFNSRLPHRFRNPGDAPCEFISACSPPSF